MREAIVDIQPQEFELHSERIGGTAALAVNGVEPMVIEGRKVVIR